MTAFVTRTVGDVVSEILMSRTAFSGSFLVLEGDEDIKFWKPRVVDRSLCHFVLAGSKPTVIGAIVRMDELNLRGILGVVDDDCDSLLGRPLPSVNIIQTETRDIETLMLSCNAFERIVNELSDDAKVLALEQVEGRSIREVFVSRALIFGQLRYLSAARRWNVTFESLSPWRFGDVDSWTFNRSALLEDFVKQVQGLTVADLETYLASVPVASPWVIMHGKDSLKVLAMGIRKSIGNQQHSIDRLLQMLRLAFDNMLFRATQLCTAVKIWEEGNPPYRILAS